MCKFNDTIHLIIRSLRRFISLSFILALMILLVRLYELIIASNYYNYPPGSFTSLLIGLKFDIIFYLRVSAILMVPFLLIALINQKVARYFLIMSSVVIILGDMLLLKYFLTTRVPLGADLFGYNWSEIMLAVNSSGELNVWQFLFMGLFLAYMVRIFVKHVYYKLKPWMLAIVTLLMLASFLPLKILNPQPASFSNEFNMFVATNKFDFFSESVIKRYWYKGKISDQTYTFKTFASQDYESFNYIDEEYPFLHTETTPNVLNEYFDLGETRPNIAFIIVESLPHCMPGQDFQQ